LLLVSEFIDTDNGELWMAGRCSIASTSRSMSGMYFSEHSHSSR
jgi:hypothetical protein